MATTVVHTVLNRKNYDDWSYQIETYMLAKDLLDVLHQVPPITENEEVSKAWKKKDAKALYAIWNSCGDDTYSLIKRATTAKQAWDALSDELKKPSEPSDENEKKSILHAYPPPIDHGTTPLLARKSWTEEREPTFAEYVKSDDWGNVINCLRKNSQAGSETLPFVRSGTVLHYAIQKNCSVRIIQQLMEKMEEEHLDITDDNGLTALHLLIRDYPERFEIAESMVKKNNRFVTNSPPLFLVPFVVEAQEKPNGEMMARSLYSLTPAEALEVPYAARLITLGFNFNRPDIALDLIQHYPKLAMAIDCNGNIPLVTLASKRLAFQSGSRLSLWEKLIYFGICIKPLPRLSNQMLSNKEENQGPLSDQKENQGHLISSGTGLFQGLATKLPTCLCSGINRIYKMKLMHEQVQQFLPLMCKASKEILTAKKGSTGYYKRKKLEEALLLAVEQGHVEYITHFFEDFSYPVHYMNDKRQSLYQIAAECRHHKVYNLIYALSHSDRIQEIVGTKDKFGNNMLHTVASITPLSQIYHIQGAALQMQRELQWFKEVESLANPKDCEAVNKKNMTPREVFIENHKEMWKEAENSMKETATSCTVVGALIVTIMFAAVFTVPGGNNGDTGLPTFLTKKVFIAFVFSDAISLFSSTTSIIMFLGILTSRYSQDDFYKSLPTKMMIGLFSLLLSIASMMIVFSCALYIMLDGKLSIVIASILIASVPVTSFIWIQFPLLVDIFISTYGPRMFGENKTTWFRFLCDL